MLATSRPVVPAVAAPQRRSITRASADRPLQRIGQLGAVLAASLALVSPATAEIRLPPIDKDPNRCERAFTGNTIGQANAVSDKVLDLRGCIFDGKSLQSKNLSGALMVDSSLKKANMTEVVMSKAYAPNANFDGADFTNAVLDRVVFDGSSLKGAQFVNAVITGSTFDGADLTDAVFLDSLIGQEDLKRLCQNKTVVGETRFQAGCRN